MTKVTSHRPTVFLAATAMWSGFMVADTLAHAVCSPVIPPWVTVSVVTVRVDGEVVFDQLEVGDGAEIPQWIEIVEGVRVATSFYISGNGRGGLIDAAKVDLW